MQVSPVVAIIYLPNTKCDAFIIFSECKYLLYIY